MRRAVMLAMVLLLCGVLWAEKKIPEVVEKMGLKKAVVEGATIYYEPCLEAKLEVFKKAYADYREKADARRQQQGIDVSEFSSKKDAVLEDIFQIVGIKDPDIKTNLGSFADGFMNIGASLPMPLTGSDNVIYLMLQSTSKDYLRNGGTLPNVKYDKETDSASMSLFVGSETDLSSNQVLSMPVKSADDIESVLNKILTLLPKAIHEDSVVIKGVTVHEVAEMAILLRLKSNDPYRRWFSDGFANAITYEILQRHFSEADAEDFLDAYLTASCRHLKSACNLQYWFNADLSMSNHPPIQQEDEFTYARYCFATEQGRRMVKTYGIDCIKKILDQYLETGNKHPGQLLAAIKKATGDEIAKHLAAYQSFATVDEGIKLYQSKMDAARIAKDYPGVIFAMLRILELRGENPFEKDNLNLRLAIANLLCMDGHEPAATEWITEFSDLMCHTGKPQNQDAGCHLVIVYALKTGRPQTAQRYAHDMLRRHPDDIYSLTIVMLHEESKQNTEKVIELARKICEIQPRPNDPSREIAEELLRKHGETIQIDL